MYTDTYAYSRTLHQDSRNNLFESIWYIIDMRGCIAGLVMFGVSQ